MSEVDKRLQLIAAYKECFGTDAGKIVLHDLCKQHFLEDQTFAPGSFDGTAFNEGRREVILRINRRLAAKPEDIEPRLAITKEKE